MNDFHLDPSGQVAAYPCKKCGALVVASSTPTHEHWHEDLDNIAKLAGTPLAPIEQTGDLVGAMDAKQFERYVDRLAELDRRGLRQPAPDMDTFVERIVTAMSEALDERQWFRVGRTPPDYSPPGAPVVTSLDDVSFSGERVKPPHAVPPPSPSRVHW